MRWHRQSDHIHSFREKLEVIELLREQAIIQSVESSNRIKGVIIAANRLHPVVLVKSKPMTGTRRNWRTTGKHRRGFSLEETNPGVEQAGYSVLL